MNNISTIKKTQKPQTTYENQIRNAPLFYSISFDWHVTHCLFPSRSSISFSVHPKKKKINRSNNISRFAKTHTLPFFSACVSGVLKRAMDEFETVWHKLAIIIIT